LDLAYDGQLSWCPGRFLTSPSLDRLNAGVLCDPADSVVPLFLIGIRAAGPFPLCAPAIPRHLEVRLPLFFHRCPIPQLDTGHRCFFLLLVVDPVIFLNTSPVFMAGGSPPSSPRPLFCAVISGRVTEPHKISFLRLGVFSFPPDFCRRRLFARSSEWQQVLRPTCPPAGSCPLGVVPSQFSLGTPSLPSAGIDEAPWALFLCG